MDSLRSGEVADGQVETPPGLAALDTLVAHHAAAGLAVTVTTDGEPRALGAAVDQAAYRILQESLTNAARHGAGDTHVDVHFARSALQLAVPTQRSPSPTALPMAGTACSGSRTCNPARSTLTAKQEDGVFCVRAALPYGEERR